VTTYLEGYLEGVDLGQLSLKVWDPLVFVCVEYILLDNLNKNEESENI